MLNKAMDIISHLRAARKRARGSLQREVLVREGSEGVRQVGLGREEKGCGPVLDALAHQKLQQGYIVGRSNHGA